MLVDQFLDIRLFLHGVRLSWIISLLSWAMAIPADVLDGSGPDLEFTTQHISLLSVTLHKGNIQDKLDEEVNEE